MLGVGAVVAHRYALTDLAGQGGLSTAWFAWDRAAEREVVLKVLAPGHDPTWLRAEFDHLSQLFHPHLVGVHDVGSCALAEGRAPFLVSEAVRGEALDAWARGASWARLERVVQAVLSALWFLHERGLRHGDVKPDNVLVGPEDRAVLIDLSCASPRVTQSEFVSGTAGFLAPELLVGERADQRADLFALGVTLERLWPLLEAPPPGPVRAWAARLVSADPAARPRSAADAMASLGLAPPAKPPPAFEVPRAIGRDGELAEIDEIVGAWCARAPGPRALVIEGASGAGRSRLLRELRRRLPADVEVLEGLVGRPRAIAAMLERALGEELALDGVALALAARSALGRLVLLVDDAHLAEPREQALLRALVGALEPSDAPLLVLAGDADATLEGPAVRRILLPPLGPAVATTWLAQAGVSGVPAEVLDALDGSAAAIAGLVAEHASGGVAGSYDVHGRERARVARLDPEAQAALARVALARGQLDVTALDRCGVGRDVTTRLIGAGLVRSERGALVVTRSAVAGAVAASLASGVITAARRDVLDCLADRARGAKGAARAALVAAMAEHHGWLDEWDLARASLEEALPFAAHAATAVRRAAELLAARGPGGDEEIAILGLLETGDAARARVTAERLRGAPGARRASVDELFVRALLAEGDAARAGEVMSSLLAEAGSHPALLELGARVACRAGRYAEGRELALAAQAALPGAPAPPTLAAEIHEDLGVASSYLGDHVAARAELALALAAAGPDASPRTRYRLHAYAGIDAYRSGDVARAALEYRQALDVAERHGLDDAVARASLNVATAAHQAGTLAAALDGYARAARIAGLVGQRDVVALAAMNEAKLLVDLGAHERGERRARQARVAADAAGLPFAAAAAESVLAEALAGRGELDAARLASGRAEEGFDALGAVRERAEVRLERALWLAEAGQDATRALADASASLASCDAPDLVPREALARATVALSRGDAPAAVGAARRALDGPQGGPLAHAHAEALLCRALGETGEPAAGRAAAARGAARLETVRASLPVDLADALAAHPRFAALLLPPSAPARSSVARSSAREAKLERLLALYRRLATGTEPTDVLALALDAAIELAGAERGFLVLVDPRTGGLHVPVARNVDREELGKSQHKFSHDIAEEAMRTGAPVSTVDARADARFAASTSVHAMRLRAVLAVPIRSPDGVLGALYLDNRLRDGRFSPDDVSLLQDFADHAALVLRSARLIEDLRRRTEELDRERARVAELAEAREREIVRLHGEAEDRQRVLERFDRRAFVGRSPALDKLFGTLERVADAPVPVLIEGESGTGKELAARAVHFGGARKKAPFVGINCAALPAGLLEAELFGHVRGAFTGADRDRQGLMVAAQGGTLFLDELGELPLDVQAKLLRVLQEREVRPVGGDAAIAVDFRLVTATNRHLPDEVAAGRFREDLYYRVGVVTLRIPPLRERLDDLPELARHFVDKAARDLGRPPPALSAQALRALAAHPWPGNVRELENALTRAVLLAPSSGIGAADLELGAPRGHAPSTRRRGPEDGERSRILEALARTGWNAALAARELGMPRATFYRRLDHFGVARPRG